MYRRHIRARWRLYARRTRQFILHNVLHADDPPHRLALGIAIGVWVTFTPTIGFQMALVVLLAWLLRANKVVGLPVVWISNPVTFVPIFWPSYWVGATLLGQELIRDGYWRELLHPPPGWWEGTVFYWQSFMEIAAPLWLGSLIVGTGVAGISYVVCHRLICWYRIRRWGGLVPPSMALVRRPRDGASHASASRPPARQRRERRTPNIAPATSLHGDSPPNT